MRNADFLLQQLLDISTKSPKGGAKVPAGRQGRYSTVSDSPPHVMNVDLLQSIHEWRGRGKSFGAIAALLNKQGFSGRYGARWYASSVWAYLQRRS